MNPKLSSIAKPAIVALLAILLFSCRQAEFKEEYRDVKHTKKQVVLAQRQLKKVKVDELRNLQSIIKKDIDFVNDNSKLFIMDSSFVQTFGLYGATGKTISRVLRTDFDKLAVDLLRSNQQLGLLGRDIRHQLLPSDSISIFCASEIGHAKELLATVEKLNESIEMQYEAYEITNEPMARYINRVKNMMYLE